MAHNDIAAAFLADLKTKRTELRSEHERIGNELKRVSDAIEAIERLSPAQADPAATILVSADQFRGMTTARALRKLLLSVDRPLRAMEMAQTLVRGGLEEDVMKVRERIAYNLKSWRRQKLVTRDEVAQSWELSEKGKDVFANVTDQPGEDDDPELPLTRSGQR